MTRLLIWLNLIRQWRHFGMALIRNTIFARWFQYCFHHLFWKEYIRRRRQSLIYNKSNLPKLQWVSLCHTYLLFKDYRWPIWSEWRGEQWRWTSSRRLHQRHVKQPIRGAHRGLRNLPGYFYYSNYYNINYYKKKVASTEQSPERVSPKIADSAGRGGVVGI